MERTFFTASAIFAFVMVTAIVVTKREPQVHAAFEQSHYRHAR